MLLDIRENGLRLILPSHESKQLLVGDVWIGLSGEHIAKGGVCVERKQVNDLIARNMVRDHSILLRVTWIVLQ